MHLALFKKKRPKIPKKKGVASLVFLFVFYFGAACGRVTAFSRL